jgi:hypothetical protein
MPAEIIQFVPKPNPNRDNTLGQCGPCESATLTIAELPEKAPYNGAGIDGMGLEKEPT